MGGDNKAYLLNMGQYDEQLEFIWTSEEIYWTAGQITRDQSINYRVYFGFSVNIIVWKI